MTRQKSLEWDQRAEVSRISLGYEGRRPTSEQDETEWEWGREWQAPPTVFRTTLPTVISD